MTIFILFENKLNKISGVYFSKKTAMEEAIKLDKLSLFKGIKFHIEKHTVSE